MKSYPLLLVVFSLMVAAAPAASAETEEIEDLANIEDLSLEQLLRIETDVAGARPTTTRESPGIITLITRDEIRASGSRDLVDALQLVPGLAFGLDVEGVVGLGVRGNWGHEGKVLLLIDGVMMNEILFTSLQFGNHYPVENIERIEVIRGPGAVKYGGYAELAVINVVTRKAAQLNGVAAEAGVGARATPDYDETGFARGSFALEHAHQVRDTDVSYDIFIKEGRGSRSMSRYTDLWGDSFAMKDQSDLDPMHVNLGVQAGGFEARVLVDRYETVTRDFYDVITETPLFVTFTSIAGRLGYTLELSESSTLRSSVSVTHQAPWRLVGPGAPENSSIYDVTAQRLQGGVTWHWAASDWIEVSAGANYFNDRARQHGLELPGAAMSAFQNGRADIDYHNVAAFAEGGFESFLGNLRVGARYEYNESYGNAVVFRGAHTKVIDDFHLKLLLSQAFRAPSIENIHAAESAGISLAPETALVAEAEVGYLLNRNIIATVNLFAMRIADPIVYFWEAATEVEGYRNLDAVGTFGGEAELRAKYAWGWATLNYSFYRPFETIPDYAVPGRDDLMLGFAAHKVTLSSSFNVGEHMHVAPSAVFLSSRFAYTGVDSEDTPIGSMQDPLLMLNLTLGYDDLLIDGLDLSLSLHNILGQPYTFIQPYNSYHAPLPGLDPEIMARLSYELPF